MHCTAVADQMFIDTIFILIFLVGWFIEAANQLAADVGPLMHPPDPTTAQPQSSSPKNCLSASRKNMPIRFEYGSQAQTAACGRYQV